MLPLGGVLEPRTSHSIGIDLTNMLYRPHSTHQEGLPGAALSDESSPADDFVMIANDLVHSAAQSSSKDVVSIGMGALEDGLCEAASESQNS